MQPYKNRIIDYSKPVMVYRNLHNKQFVWSVKQGSLVMAHANRICMKNVNFIVKQSGRNKVLLEKQKNVHAYVVGYICADTCQYQNMIPVTYNPYHMDSFVKKNLDYSIQEKIMQASLVIMNAEGNVFAYI